MSLPKPSSLMLRNKDGGGRASARRATNGKGSVWSLSASRPCDALLGSALVVEASERCGIETHSHGVAWQLCRLFLLRLLFCVVDHSPRTEAVESSTESNDDPFIVRRKRRSSALQSHASGQLPSRSRRLCRFGAQLVKAADATTTCTAAHSTFAGDTKQPPLFTTVVRVKRR